MNRRCPACRGRPGPELLVREAVPVVCNALHDDTAAARAVPRGDIRLAACRDCGLVFNAAFEPALVRYDAAYENALHFSPRFRAFQEQTVRRLVDGHGLRGTRVLEIGCGDASFLSALALAGDNRCIGVDPSFDRARARIPDGVDVVVHAGSFDDIHERADAVVCRHVLEHLCDAAPLLASVRDALAGGDPGLLYLEVPSWRATLERDAFWDVLYEHVAYHDVGTLAATVARHGFKVLETREAYGGQFATLVARAAPASPPSRPGSGAPAAPAAPAIDVGAAAAAATLAAREAAFVAGWRDWVQARSPAERLIVWGAGTKGVMLLNLLGGAARRIAAAVDLNPRKQGRHVAGTGTPIVAPNDLPARVGEAPLQVLVMNPLYAGEIRAELDRLGLERARLVPATGPPADEGAATGSPAVS